MSDNWADDDDSGQSDTGGNLRSQLETALAKIKTLEKQKAATDGKLAQITASKVLKDKGYKPDETSKWAAKDGVDLGDEAALDKWLTENESLLVGFKSEQVGESSDSPQEQVVPDPLANPELVNNQSVLSQLHAQAQPADANKYVTASAGLPANATPEQVRAAFAGL